MKKSEILRYAATDLLRNYQIFYVCHAIRRAADDWKYPRSVSRELTDMIGESLDDCCTVMQWLSKYRNEWYRENICTGKVTIQEYRIAWCLQMAEMYENRGE